MCYLSVTRNFGIIFFKTDKEVDGELIGNIDTEFGGDRDERKYTTGWVFLPEGGALN